MTRTERPCLLVFLKRPDLHAADPSVHHPLACVSMQLLKASHVDEVRLCRFLIRLEEGYPGG